MLGLGLLAGAVLQRTAGAQADTSRARRDSARVRRDSTVRRDSAAIVIPARPTADSVLRDSLAKRDSLHPKIPPRDSIKAPFARGPMPVPIEIGQSLVFDRAQLFASGAVTLQDLLDRIPEITGLRAGWIAAPMVSSFMGDVRRVRVFVDGVEYDELDPRTGGILDLTQVQLWVFEELRIERGATEIRVYARTWRVERTTPYTRTDISTGDQQTNMYRGFFGRRWGHGEGVQVAAQQYGTTPPIRGSPSSDATTLLGRLGWAAKGWSFDGFVLRNSRNRGAIFSQFLRGVTFFNDTLPALQSTRTDAYLRAGYGDPERGPWLQAIASSLGYGIEHSAASAFGSTTTDTTKSDTALFRAQYVVTGGFTWGGLRLDAAERLRMGDARRLWTPSGRAEFVSGPLALSAFAEGKGPDSIARVEAAARLTLLSFVSVLGTAGRSTDSHAPDLSSTANFLRAEAAIRFFGLWLGGGAVRRDSVLLLPPRVFGPYVTVEEAAATGVTARIEGRLYKALRLNMTGIRWNDSSGLYRPQYQSRSEIYVATNWLSRFPSGNFGILASLSHEYRSKTLFPRSESAGTFTVTSVPDSRIYNFHLEIRIVSAVLSYQFRNIEGTPYQLVPGYLMPRLNQFYGVRWEFWN
ncbi:MAG TPA: hypothetical protein VJW73_19345 [Gemmatimonadaceae bacterium]|nr:hypothetical protein [Gemmatimonadaceae bacterium]